MSLNHFVIILPLVITLSSKCTHRNWPIDMSSMPKLNKIWKQRSFCLQNKEIMSLQEPKHSQASIMSKDI